MVGTRRIDQHVGERIRMRRAELGLTQEQLAQALKVSYQQVQKYETGANRISAGRIYEIARKLGVDIGYFSRAWGSTSRRADAAGAWRRQRSAIELVRKFAQIKIPMFDPRLPDWSRRSSIAKLIPSAGSAAGHHQWRRRRCLDQVGAADHPPRAGSANSARSSLLCMVWPAEPRSAARNAPARYRSPRLSNLCGARTRRQSAGLLRSGRDRG